jgi:hypothetical protein
LKQQRFSSHPVMYPAFLKCPEKLALLSAKSGVILLSIGGKSITLTTGSLPLSNDVEPATKVALCWIGVLAAAC